MKITTLIFALSFPLLAQAWFIDFSEGDFTAPKTVSLPSIHSQRACDQAGGVWKRETCYFTTSDDVSVAKNHTGGYDVLVSTVGADARSCHFESTGALQSDGTLVSSFATALGACNVVLTYAGTDWVSVKSNGSCQSLCEHESLSLDIARAKRIEIPGP